jgi:hypothetical protein
VISAFVYHHWAQGLRANHEVEEAFWVSLDLADPRGGSPTDIPCSAPRSTGILVGIRRGTSSGGSPTASSRSCLPRRRALPDRQGALA